MGINPTAFRHAIIRPVLLHLEEHAGISHTPAAEDLLMITAALESSLGSFLPVYGMTDAMIGELDDSFITPSPRFKPAVAGLLASTIPLRLQCMWNLYAATATARLWYYRVKSPLPDGDNLRDLLQYYETNFTGQSTSDLRWNQALQLTDLIGDHHA
jgi:hypothetical protein